MGQNTIARRQVVRTAAALAAGGALVGGTGVAAASASDGDSGHGHGLLGAWWVTHTDDPPGDPTPGITVVSFASGGALAAADIRPAGGTGVGAWSADGSRFRASYWAAVPLGPPDTPGGSINIRVKGRLRLDSISGTYAVTVFDATGAQLQAGTGKFTGRRLRA